MKQYRIISTNKYGSELLYKGTYDKCFDFCKIKNWKFIDKNKDETILEIF